MTQTCKAIIFDMDGVLVDSEPVHIHAHERYFRDMGLTLDPSIIYERFIGSTSTPLWTTLKEIYHLPQPLEELIAKGREYETTQEDIDGFPPIPYIPELLRDVRSHGLRTAVASSSPLSRIRRTLASLQIEDCFDECVSGTRLAHPKPAPDTFLAAAEALGVRPEECLVIEDSGNGVRAAVAAGMPCVAFHNPHSGVQDLSPADVIVESFEEVTADFLLQVYAHHFHLPARILKTDRFSLRELSMSDLSDFERLLAEEPQAVLPGAFPKDPEQLQDFLHSYILHQYPFYGFGLWAAVDEQNHIIGLYGLHMTEASEDLVPEACWLTDPQLRRQGYAGDAMKAICSYAEDSLGCRGICARIAPDNTASLRLAERLHMHLTSDGCYLVIF